MQINDRSLVPEYSFVDILENSIRETMPEILNILLVDRTTSTSKKLKNIIWANENYISYGTKMYAPTAQMKPELVTGKMGQLIKPRALKSRELQKERTKTRAEVLLNYIKSKFGRVMLGIMKTTQNNQSKNTWSKVPLQDFTTNSDIDWTKDIPEIDQQLYKKYGLDQSEIDFIEEKVKAMA